MVYIKQAKFACVKCQKTFTSARALKAHNKTKHAKKGSADARTTK